MSVEMTGQPSGPERPLTARIRADGQMVDLDAYEQSGGYGALRAALKMTSHEVQEVVKASRLRGRGGAGFLTGAKWSFVPMGAQARRPKYLAINADEMEPGTMKDRLLLEGDPHQLIEGALIAAHAIEADVIFLFLRWAYRLAARRLEKALAEAYEHHVLGRNILGSSMHVEMYLHISAGRYMCGEEDGLLDALEGKRAIPRTKPPYPQTCGLWGKPTVVNNVETLCCLPHILRNGPDWFRGLSLCEDGGTKLYGVSGHVQKPGLWELPLGTSLREIVFDHAGGMQDGYRFRAVLPGGGSTNFMLEQHLDVPMDFESVSKQSDSRMGTGTAAVMDDRVCPVGLLVSLERFFARESCGWCTPCREGLPWVVRTLEAIEAGQGRDEDMEILDMHARLLHPGATFCALAPGAAEPLKGALKYFRDDFLRHIAEHRCPWK